MCAPPSISSITSLNLTPNFYVSMVIKICLFSFYLKGRETEGEIVHLVVLFLSTCNSQHRVLRGREPRTPAPRIHVCQKLDAGQWWASTPGTPRWERGVSSGILAAVSVAHSSVPIQTQLLPLDTWCQGVVMPPWGPWQWRREESRVMSGVPQAQAPLPPETPAARPGGWHVWSHRQTSRCHPAYCHRCKNTDGLVGGVG